MKYLNTSFSSPANSEEYRENWERIFGRKEEKEDDRLLIFTYGTLMKGEFRAAVLNQSVFLGPTKTKEKYLMRDLGSFPCIEHPQTDNDLKLAVQITGEVYEITPEVLSWIDHIEGHPNFYKREKITTENGLRAWAYFFDGSEGGQLILHGSWKNRSAWSNK